MKIMSTRNINIFGFNSFVISSIFIIFIVSFPSLGVLRVPLLITHFSFFYFFNLFRFKKVFFNTNILFIFLLIFYIVIQNLYLQDDFLSIIQAIVVTFFLFIASQLALSERPYYLKQNKHVFLAKILLFILPFFLISFTQWSDFRKPGLFMNPNVTSQLSVMLLPFVILGLNNRRLKAAGICIVLLIAIITASRSTLMALLLSVIIYITVAKFPKLKFPSLLLILSTTTVISIYAVDIAIWVFNAFSSFLSQSNSRLLYLGYNGRDVLLDLAIERFKTQPYFGLGFGGVKFDFDGHVLGTHNGLIEILIKFGAIGAIIFTIFIISLISIISKHDPKFKAVSMMSLTAILSLSTNSSTFFVLNYLFIYTVLLVYLGVPKKTSTNI